MADLVRAILMGLLTVGLGLIVRWATDEPIPVGEFVQKFMISSGAVLIALSLWGRA